MERDFRDMLVALSDEKVEYLVVGAHAMAVHGCPRATHDIDFWVRPSPENAKRVLRALAIFGAPLQSVVAQDFENPGTIFQIGLPPLRIDVITSIDGVTFDEAWPNRLEVEMDGLAAIVIGHDELLKNKKATGRPKDVSDAKMLEMQKANKRS
jgi:hypothetical protein